MIELPEGKTISLDLDQLVKRLPHGAVIQAVNIGHDPTTTWQNGDASPTVTWVVAVWQRRP